MSIHILVAPGAYKGTITSLAAGDAITAGVRDFLPASSISRLVLADGGEGTVEMFCTYFECRVHTIHVRNPIGRTIPAKLCLLDDGTVVVESCQAVGFSLLKAPEMNPFVASSYGVGEMIKQAVERGAKRVFITMGDSAIMDMGVGMLDALGVKFYRSSGELVCPSLQTLSDISDFDCSSLFEMLRSTEFVGLVDTDDYLCGPDGQVQLYGRQKGLRDEDIHCVEAAFRSFSGCIKKKMGVDVLTVPRATGSGGLGAAVHAFLNANLLNTLEYLSDRLGWDAFIRSADMVITGEGRLDEQTKYGKVPYFIAKRVPRRCVCMVGSYTAAGRSDVIDLVPGTLFLTLNPEFAMSQPTTALRQLAEGISLVMVPTP